MTLELVPLSTMVVELADPLVLPNTPSGTRVIVEVNSFTVVGDRLKASNKEQPAPTGSPSGPRERHPRRPGRHGDQ